MICNSNPCPDRFSKGTWAKNLPDLSSRSVWLGLFLAVLWAAFLEIALVARSPIIARDGILFVKLAQSLDFDTSLVLKADQQPGYPILIWAIHRISSARASGNSLESWISVARWIAGVSGILLVPVSWFLTWKLFNPPAALATAFLVASLPLFRQNAADALSDAPHLLLYLLSVWLLVEGFQRWKWAYFLASGLLSIMAFSLRPEGLGPVVAGGAILLLCGLKTGRLTVAVRIKCLLALLFGILLALAPFVFYAGKFSTKKRFDNILAQNTCREEALMHPLQFLYRGSSEFLGEGSHAFYYVLLIPLAFGLLSALRHRIDAWVGRFAAALIIIHVSLLVILYANWCYLSERHMMPIVAVCMPWIGSGTALLSQTVHERLRRICSPRHAFAGIVLLVVAVMLPRALRPLHEASMPLVDFARRLGEQAAPADTLLANSSYVPFYSGLEGRVIEAVQSIDEMRDAQGRLPYRWVVLEMGSSNFNAQWPSQLASEYHQVANDHLYKGSKKVLFFEKN